MGWSAVIDPTIIRSIEQIRDLADTILKAAKPIRQEGYWPFEADREGPWTFHHGFGSWDVVVDAHVCLGGAGPASWPVKVLWASVSPDEVFILPIDPKYTLSFFKVFVREEINALHR